MVFDFDGTLVESLHIKTQAFRQLFRERQDVVNAIVAYHLRHTGISRFEKLGYIYRRILHEPLSARRRQMVARRFGRLVVKQVITCPFVPGALKLLKKWAGKIPLFVLTATPIDELRYILRKRKLDSLFTEAFGAPLHKETALRKILRQYHLRPYETVYIGDSEADYLAAQKTQVGFIGRLIDAQKNLFPPYIPTVTNLTQVGRILSRNYQFE